MNQYELYTEECLKEKTVSELKIELNKMSLSQNGKKSDLINRLIEYKKEKDEEKIKIPLKQRIKATSIFLPKNTAKLSNVPILSPLPTLPSIDFYHAKETFSYDQTIFLLQVLSDDSLLKLASQGVSEYMLEFFLNDDFWQYRASKRLHLKNDTIPMGSWKLYWFASRSPSYWLPIKKDLTCVSNIAFRTMYESCTVYTKHDMKEEYDHVDFSLLVYPQLEQVTCFYVAMFKNGSIVSFANDFTWNVETLDELKLKIPLSCLDMIKTIGRISLVDNPIVFADINSVNMEEQIMIKIQLLNT